MQFVRGNGINESYSGGKSRQGTPGRGNLSEKKGRVMKI